MTGRGDRGGPSVISETYCKGQRGEGERRETESLQRTAFIWQAVRETGLRQQNHQREREGTSVRWIWMASVYGGRGSLMTMGTAVLYYPWALLAESYQTPSSPLGSPQVPMRNRNICGKPSCRGMEMRTLLFNISGNVLKLDTACVIAMWLLTQADNRLRTRAVLESYRMCNDWSWTHSFATHGTAKLHIWTLSRAIISTLINYTHKLSH